MISKQLKLLMKALSKVMIETLMQALMLLLLTLQTSTLTLTSTVMNYLSTLMFHLYLILKLKILRTFPVLYQISVALLKLSSLPLSLNLRRLKAKRKPKKVMKLKPLTMRVPMTILKMKLLVISFDAMTQTVNQKSEEIQTFLCLSKKILLSLNKNECKYCDRVITLLQRSNQYNLRQIQN